MKKLTLIILLFVNISIFAQNTYVPDDNFEQALIDLGYDTGALDDYVPTENINIVTTLDVSSKDISDLTGIEDFISLTELHCELNQLTNLDVSQNIDLIDLICYSNQLTSLDLTQNTALSVLGCNSNQLTSLDLSQNVSLTILSCYNNQLTSIDVRNGNNTNITDFYSDGNPYLTCILVDDATWSDTNWTNIDFASTFVETDAECNALYTYVPDDNFEQELIVLGYDIVQDDFVPTANISDVSSLFISNKNINDLTGIEDFLSLTLLDCKSNQITSLNISQNTAINILFCSMNQLTVLDMRNGNNTNLTNFDAISNPNLTCIFVDDATWSETNWTNIDPVSNFVETQTECDALAVDDIFHATDLIIYPNPTKEKFRIQINNEIESLKICDVFGKIIKVYHKQETYSVSDLSKGVYLIQIKSKDDFKTSKLIIE